MNKQGMIGGLVLWILIIWVIMAVSACSFGVQIGYHGETGIDDREFTPKESRK